MPRETVTPFRKSQARSVLEGIVRWLAPQMQRHDGLREALRELVDDRELWAELEIARSDAVPAAPVLRSYWEHRCDVDDHLYKLDRGEQCGRCGERDGFSRVDG